MIELWKDIEGYEGKYQISTEGNTKSLNYNNTGQEGLLKPKINRYGYREVKLSKNNKTKNYLVCTLVGNAFIPKPAPDMGIMHIKEIDKDCVSNLRWAYRSEILYQTYKKGRREGISSGYKISYKGKRYKSLNAMGKDYLKDGRRFFHRIERGWTLEEALEIPIERKEKILNKQLYKYKGNLMPIKQLSELSGINEKAIRKRLKRGWSVEEAVEIPLAKNKRKEVK